MDNEKFHYLLSILAGEGYSPEDAKYHIKNLIVASRLDSTPIEVKDAIGFMERILSAMSTEQTTDTLLIAHLGDRVFNAPYKALNIPAN